MLANAYANELVVYPAWAVRQACDDFRLGRVGSRDFMPSVAAMLDRVRPLIIKHSQELARIAMVLEAKVDASDEPTPEEREAMKDRVAKLAYGITRNTEDYKRMKSREEMLREEAEAKLEKAGPIPTDILERDLPRLMGERG